MKDLSTIIQQIVPMPYISYNRNSMKGITGGVKIPKGFKRRAPKLYRNKKRNIIILSI